MRHSSHFAAAFSLVLAPLAVAQAPSVLDLDATYHLVQIGAQVSNPMAPGPDSISAVRANATLQPNGTFSFVSAEQTIEGPGMIFTQSPTGSGVYTVTPDAKIVLDDDPANPGSDPLTLSIGSDAALLLGTRNDADDELLITFGVETSTGQSAASLTGTYHWTQTAISRDAGGMATRSASGIVSLDGAGGLSVLADEQTVTSTGNVITTTGVTSTGTYTVAPDGLVDASGLGSGAVSPNGDVFFLLDFSPSSTEIVFSIAARIGTDYDLNTLQGSYAVVSSAITLAPQASMPPEIDTQDIQLQLDEGPSVFGTFDGSAESYSTDPSGTSTSLDTFSGVTNLFPGGILQLIDPVSGPIRDIRFAADRSLFISSELDGSSSLILGIRTCGDAEAYGTPTPGTGNRPPILSIRGFAQADSPDFALSITNGRGAAAVALPISLGQAGGSGLPLLGGVLWIDPVPILATVSLGLSGAPGAPGAGEATLPLFLAADSTLLGVSFFAQALVLDPAAPMGLAMSNGQRFVFCR